MTQQEPDPPRQAQQHPAFSLRLTPERALVALGALVWAAKIGRDGGAPSWPLTLLLTTAAALAVAVVFARRPGTRWLDGPRLVLVLLALFFFPTVYGGVGGDGLEYYALLRSGTLDFDLDLANDYQGLGARPVITPEGAITSRVTIGTAVVWAAPFLTVHTILKVASWLGSPIPANGFSPVYLSTVTSTTYVCALAALLLLEAALRRRHGPVVALLSVVGIWLATPLHYYITANPSMSHGASFFTATLFVLSWLRARDVGRGFGLVGFCGGLMALIRPQDAVLLVMPLLDLARRDRRGLSSAARLLIGPSLLALAQTLIWLRMYGLDFMRTVATVNWVGGSMPQVWELLFAARHGLLTWTPLYVVALAGWLLWARRDTRTAGLVGLAFLLSVLVNSALLDWWGSDSLGQRRLLALTPLFALGLAEAVSYLRRHPLVMAWAFVVGLALWNLQLAYIFNSEVLASRSEAISLDRLAGAQVEVFYRRLLRWERFLPRKVWFFLYDNLKGVWLDEGSRSLGGIVNLGLGEEPPDLPIVVGHNWYGPEASSGVGFRRSRGRRSWLRVPIRTAGEFEATLRARSEMQKVPVTVALEVNGQIVGETPLQEGWGEYVFRVPAEIVRPGFNEIALVYSTTPREAMPEHSGKNSAAAVDWLKWKRQGVRWRRPRWHMQVEVVD